VLTTRSEMTILSHMTVQSVEDELAERGGRAQRRASKTRERLLKAALASFGEKGVDARPSKTSPNGPMLGKAPSTGISRTSMIWSSP